VVLARQGIIIYPNKLSITTYLEHMPLIHHNAHKEFGGQKNLELVRNTLYISQRENIRKFASQGKCRNLH